jgi:hypothetical protein
MLLGMDDFYDLEPRHSLQVRHLHAVGSHAPPIDLAGRPMPVGDDFTRRQLDLFDRLIEAVGSPDALWCLDVLPLPDEPFDWTAVEPGDLEYVTEVVALSDRCCDELFDVEHRTAARRVLARVAANDPRPLRRHPHAARCAASLVWLVGAANGDFGRDGRFRSSLLWSWFGVGTCDGRSRTLQHAAGLEPNTRWPDPSALGDPSVLVAWMRARLVDQRDHLLDIAERRRTWSVIGDDGRSVRVAVRAQPATVVHSTKAVVHESGRAIVLVGFGEHLEDAEFLSLTIPDAHDLVHKVQAALDTPLPAVVV